MNTVNLKNTKTNPFLYAFLLICGILEQYQYHTTLYGKGVVISMGEL
jgi:hypothetical protein